MTTPRSVPLALCAAALAAALGLLAMPAAGAAEGSPKDAVSWSVSPADETGEDGRVSIQHELDPGESLQEHVVVRNLGAGDVVFSLSAADGYYTDAGRFDMLRSDQESVDAGSWITLPEDVEIGAGESAVVPFTITVPDDAEPGDHAAGVAASVLSVKSEGAKANGVGVESRVGVKVITRVAGEVVPAFAVQDVRADHHVDPSPFLPGSVTVSFDVENTGNVRMDAAGQLQIANRTIAFPADGERAQVLLPGERRSFSLEVDDVWPLFLLTGDLMVAPVASSLAGDELAVDVAVASLVIWAMPWPQLLLVVGIALIALALAWNRIRARRRTDHLISQAHERGRQEALDEARREKVTR